MQYLDDLLEESLLLTKVYLVVRQNVSWLSWRWLVLAQHGDHKLHRQTLMAKFRKLLYAKTVQDYETEMEAFLNDPFVRKSEKFFAHLRKTILVRNGACMLEMI